MIFNNFSVNKLCKFSVFCVASLLIGSISLFAADKFPKNTQMTLAEKCFAPQFRAIINSSSLQQVGNNLVKAAYDCGDRSLYYRIFPISGWSETGRFAVVASVDDGKLLSGASGNSAVSADEARAINSFYAQERERNEQLRNFLQQGERNERESVAKLEHVEHIQP